LTAADQSDFDAIAFTPLAAGDPLLAPTPASGLLGRSFVGVNREVGAVHMRYVAQPDFANRHGTVQGGLLSAMLDSATALALGAQLPPGLTAVTMRLDTAFLRPAPLGSLDVRARVLQRSEREALSLGEVIGADGEVLARATATLRVRPRR
jgi:uncharacterized protein (TIGR00369 family)